MMDSKLSVSGMIKEGFVKTVDHIGVLLKGLFFAVLTVIAITMVLAIANIGFLSAIWSMLPRLKIVGACGTDVACMQVALRPLIEFLSGNIIVFVFSICIILIGFFYMMFGYINYTLRVYDWSNAGFLDLFPSFGRVVKASVASLIVSLIVVCGFVLLIIPGIYLLIRFGFFVYFILDKNVGIFDSLKMSWRVTRGYCWELLALLLCGILLRIVGNATIIGWLFAFPMIYVTQAAVYRHLMMLDENNHHSGM